MRWQLWVIGATPVVANAAAAIAWPGVLTIGYAIGALVFLYVWWDLWRRRG